MICASIDSTGAIVISADANSALTVSRIRDVTRTVKMPPRTWRMALTLENVAALRDAQAVFTAELAKKSDRLERLQAFVEAQKTAENVEPIAEIPLKPGCKLFQHQIKAYNISLALLGYPMSSK